LPGEAICLDEKAQSTSDPLPAIDPRNLHVQLPAQCHSGFKHWQSCHGGVEVQLIPGRATGEAVVHMTLQVGRERAAPLRGQSMHRTGTTNVISGSLVGNEANQVQHISQGDLCADCGKANARHGSRPFRPGGPSRWSEVTVGLNPDSGTEKRSPYWSGPWTRNLAILRDSAVARGQLGWSFLVMREER